MKKSFKATTVLWASLFAVGACDDAPPVVAPTTESTVAGIQGTLLQRIQLEDEHLVEFYDMGKGSLAVRETMLAGTGPEVLPGLPKLPTLSDIFRHVAPARPVPAALSDADIASAKLRREAAAEARSRPGKPAMLPARPDLIKPAGQLLTSNGVDKQSSALLNCSGDLFQDNWGANWFLANYCDTTTWPFKECQTNWGFYNRTATSDGWINARQFEGDFNEAGNMKAFFRDCTWSLLEGWVCFGVQKLDVPVRPRKVESWLFPADGDYWLISGTSPCGHLGLVLGHG